MWRKIRIAILLLALLLVSATALLDRFNAANWSDTLTVGIYPVDADGRDATRDYLNDLTRERFASIEAFFAHEAARYGIARDRPLQIRLQPASADLPPRLTPNSGVVTRLWWSLRMRWYAFRRGQGRAGKVRVFVLYHDPAVTPRVPHSLGLQKGLLGVVYAYAVRDADEANNVVIAHEILHTLGASDKYDLETLQPSYPDGYAEPQREPRWPQRLTEIMAGRRPLTETTAEMPDFLRDSLIGPLTASEIRWR